MKMNVSLKHTIREHVSMCAIVNQNNRSCNHGYQPIKEKKKSIVPMILFVPTFCAPTIMNKNYWNINNYVCLKHGIIIKIPQETGIWGWWEIEVYMKIGKKISYDKKVINLTIRWYLFFWVFAENNLFLEFKFFVFLFFSCFIINFLLNWKN